MHSNAFRPPKIEMQKLLFRNNIDGLKSEHAERKNRSKSRDPEAKEKDPKNMQDTDGKDCKFVVFFMSKSFTMIGHFELAQTANF